jgi:hypothetical protein
MASRLAERSPTFGSAWAWSSTRWSWHKASVGAEGDATLVNRLLTETEVLRR